MQETKLEHYLIPNAIIRDHERRMLEVCQEERTADYMMGDSKFSWEFKDGCSSLLVLLTCLKGDYKDEIIESMQKDVEKAFGVRCDEVYAWVECLLPASMVRVSSTHVYHFFSDGEPSDCPMRLGEKKREEDSRESQE